MKPTLVDTDTLSEFFRHNTTVVQNVKSYLQEYDAINLSIITYYEILNGLYYKDAQKQLTRFNEFVNLNKIIPLTINATKQAAKLYADLRKKGSPIGHTDSLIAGIALANNLELATNNIEHFSRVPDLELVNWLH